MIEIEVKGACNPKAHAELIAATLHGLHGLLGPTEGSSSAVTTGKLVRAQQEQAEQKRPSHDQLETVNFQTIDDDLDWTEI